MQALGFVLCDSVGDAFLSEDRPALLALADVAERRVKVLRIASIQQFRVVTGAMRDSSQFTILLVQHLRLPLRFEFRQERLDPRGRGVLPTEQRLDLLDQRPGQFDDAGAAHGVTDTLPRFSLCWFPGGVEDPVASPKEFSGAIKPVPAEL